jgi:hypothetical protein
MKKLLCAITLITILVISAAAGGNKEENNDGGFIEPTLEGYARISDEGMAFDFQWMVDGKNLHVQLAAPTTGWLSVGFDPTNKMADANILIGYVSDGSAFLRDDFGDGQVKHSPDAKLGGEEHFSDLDGNEADGTTRIRFTIPLDSGDAFDKVLEVGKTYKVIYAYGPNGKDDFGTYHTRNRGSFEITL